MNHHDRKQITILTLALFSLAALQTVSMMFKQISQPSVLGDSSLQAHTLAMVPAPITNPIGGSRVTLPLPANSNNGIIPCAALSQLQQQYCPPSPAPAPTTPTPTPSLLSYLKTTTVGCGVSNTINAIIDGQINNPIPNSGVWFTITDEKTHESINYAWLGTGVGINGIHENPRNYVSDIRAAKIMPLVGDGRLFTFRAYLTPYVSGIPTLGSPVASTQFSNYCTSPISATVTPVAQPVSGSFDFYLSNPQTSITCKLGDPNCGISTTLRAVNRTGKRLYNVTMWVSDTSGIIKYFSNGVLTSAKTTLTQFVEPNTEATNTGIKVTPPQRVGNYYVAFYMDGQTCLNPANPSSCVFNGGSGQSFNINVTN